MNFSVNEEVGLLVEGFENPPMIAMTHSLPYYDALVKGSAMPEPWTFTPTAGTSNRLPIGC
jgi:hypothetical protein